MWACVRRLTAKKPHDDHVEGISAESLNNHYCKISTNPKYVAPLLKLTVGNSDEKYIDEYKIVGVLDTLRPTATGLDGLPAWFLRTGALIFCQPLTHPFSLSLSTSKYHVSGNKPEFVQFPKLLCTHNTPQTYFYNTGLDENYGEDCSPGPNLLNIL